MSRLATFAAAIGSLLTVLPAHADADTATLGYRGRPVGKGKLGGVGAWSGGIKVRETIDQCPADDLLQVGDIVVAYDMMAITTKYKYLTWIRRNYVEGDSITVTFVRAGKEQEGTVSLGSLSLDSRRRAPLCDPPQQAPPAPPSEVPAEGSEEAP